MGQLNDAWISGHSPLPPAKLHAIGYIVAIWNSCEHGLEVLFSIVAGTPHPIGHAITHDLGSIKLFDTIINVARRRAFSPDQIALLTHAAKFYEECRLNRNQLCHFGICGTPDGNRIARRKGPMLYAPLLPDSTENIRRVGDEIRTLLDFLQAVARHLTAQQQEQPTPLPDKPTLPVRLSPSDRPREIPRRHVGARSPRPPQSSQG